MISDLAVITAILSIPIWLIVVSSGAYWLGRLSNPVDHSGKETGQLGSRVDQLGKEMGQLGSRVDQLSNRVDRLDHDMQEGFRTLREEIRHGNQQILQALASHTHDEAGQPTFHMPVSAE